MNRLIVFLPLISLLVACGPMTKTQYVSQYDGFMQEVREEHKSYDADDWEHKNEEFKHMLEDQYPAFEEHMTEEEKVRHWTQAFTYQVYQHKGRVLQELSANEEVYAEMIRENADLIADMTDQIVRDVVPEIERIAPELKELGRSILDNLEEKGTLDKLRESAKKLEESLKEIQKESEKKSRQMEI